jgi:C4-dicarboxylate-specific signal transduction histidine kinase
LLETAEARDVLVQIDIPDNIFVVVSRDRLERVYINLIDNAIDAMPDGGHIDIRGGVQDGRVLIVVEDSGSGIPEEAWATLFRPFASFKKNGLGLGLALSREVLLDNSGDLWAERKSSAGARFVMSLPLAPQSPSIVTDVLRAGAEAHD